MYELKTNNLPILSTLQAWQHGFESPFKAEVYFFSTRRFTDLKWGTQNPVMLRDPEFGPIRLRAFGSYAIRVKDAPTFLREIVGTDGRFTTEEITNQLRNMIVARFANILGQAKIPALDLAGNYDQLGQFLQQRIAPEFEAVGLELPNLLVENIPPKMFVTCLYALLNPTTGHMVFANAGHDVPYRRTRQGVVELRARGMPLGLLPNMTYDQHEATLRPGECVLLYSDGLVEAHSPTREMFGFPRLQAMMAEPDGDDLLAFLLNRLHGFTGPHWEQEDDVTMVLLAAQPRAGGEGPTGSQADGGEVLAAQPRAGGDGPGDGQGQARELLARFELPSRPGNERRAMQQVAEVLAPLGLPQGKLDKLKTAVAEATMNGMEHGNRYDETIPVLIEVTREGDDLVVSITDRGLKQPIPEAVTPDLDAKLAGQQSPRGWGLFLIQNMVDEMHVTTDDVHHTVKLVIHLTEGAQRGTTG